MAAFQNIGIDGYFKRYGFKYGIKRALFMINDIHIVNQNKVYNKLPHNLL